MSPELRARVERWLAVDPDPQSATALRSILADDPARAAAMFGGRISFGTAGLRAAMEPGPLGMNRLVVQQATAGLMRWLGPGTTVVVGYDARHNSRQFAADTAAVVAAAGGRAELLPGPLPTPVLAHAVIDRGADAGVMITASHNPAADNGYKLYLADGIQLVDPAASEIAALIDEVAAAMDGADPAPIPVDLDSVVTLGPQVDELHRAAAVAACRTDHRQVQVLYTAMHGVGGLPLLAAFEAAGFPRPRAVAAQFDPDPDFPTVSFPNPEEAGALDLAFAAADQEPPPGEAAVDVILANDPDADRLAVAVRESGGRGHWKRLSGDQVGVLLADHLFRHSDGDDRLVASSLVSSRMIDALAAGNGAESIRTLTGFKWVARPIVERPDRRFLLGYEEALGYCVGDRVRDKDGISAALVMAELVAETHAAGETLWDRLNLLAERYGVYLTAPVTVLFDRAEGSDKRSAAMAAAVADPPSTLAGVAVTEIDDLSVGGPLPPTPGVIWHLADRSRVVIRPSGTEPKLKAYLEVIEPTGGDAVAVATARAEARMVNLQAAVADILNP